MFLKVGSMQRGHINEQQKKFDTLSIPTVVIAQCILGNEKDPRTGLNCDYAMEKNLYA